MAGASVAPAASSAGRVGGKTVDVSLLTSPLLESGVESAGSSDGPSPLLLPGLGSGAPGPSVEEPRSGGPSDSRRERQVSARGCSHPTPPHPHLEAKIMTFDLPHRCCGRRGPPLERPAPSTEHLRARRGGIQTPALRFKRPSPRSRGLRKRAEHPPADALTWIVSPGDLRRRVRSVCGD